jgi:hypothetical protein
MVYGSLQNIKKHFKEIEQSRGTEAADALEPSSLGKST